MEGREDFPTASLWNYWLKPTSWLVLYMYFNADLILFWRWIETRIRWMTRILPLCNHDIYRDQLFTDLEWFGNVRHISVWNLSLMMIWNLKLSFLFIVRSDFLRISAHCKSAMEAENGCCQATEPHSCCFSNVRSQYYWANGVESLALLENSPGLLFSQMAFSWLNFHVCWLNP